MAQNYTIDDPESGKPNLSTDSLRPTMEYLLPIIKAKSFITYGEIARRLKRDLKIRGRIFPTHIGHVAGPLQNLIHNIEPKAPLLNALVVREDDKEAGHGIDGYLKARYGKFRKGQRGALSTKAAQEVYAYKRWDKLYQRAFGTRAPSEDVTALIVGPETGLHRGGDETKEHRELRVHPGSFAVLT